MPIYEYACTACGERTEAKQSFVDPPLTECALCGGSLRKLYSPVGIVFKGSGFYSTDAKKKTGSTTGSSAGAADSKPSKSDSSKPDSSESGSSKSVSSESGPAKKPEKKPDSAASTKSEKSA